jgi:hypothetical protein
MNHIDFLETIESEIVGTEPIETDEIIENTEVIDVLDEVVEENEDFDLKTEFKSKENLTDIQLILKKNAEVIEKSMHIISNIQIPKIRIPKIRVHVPKVNKYRKEEEG